MLFGSVFTLFLDELGLDKTRIGIVTSLMPFVGLLAPLVAPLAERYGLRKTFVVFWTARKFVFSMMLLTPWVLGRFGEESAFLWVGGVMLVFALCRMIAETSYYPLVQEIVPDSVRGRFGGVNSVVCGLVNMGILGVAGCVLGYYQEGLNRFMVLIVVAVSGGLGSAFCAFFLRGGAPVPRDGNGAGIHFRAMKESLQDPTFRVYTIGSALGVMALASTAFVPLYYKESIGLSDAGVVSLEIVFTLGSLVASLLWGWASDRFGSKPVMLCGVGLLILLPICWFLVPRHSVYSLRIALSIAFFSGIVFVAWAIGGSRYLYVSAVPAAKKTAYMAVYYAAIGVAGGAAPLLAGRMLDLCSGIEATVFGLQIDRYTPLFASQALLLCTVLILLARVHSDDAIPTKRFIGMFFQGNPLTAFSLLLRHRLARDETERISTTRLMGQTKSPLSTSELIESLDDPSFDVRYEAIIAIAHMRPSPRLVDALLLVLTGNIPDLSVAAAWALGRLRDRSAVLPLREGLLSEYPLLQARCARALATLGDTDSIAEFHDRLNEESDMGLKLAYAAALGTLHAEDAAVDLVAFLRAAPDESSRAEVALALARIMGHEQRYVRLWRAMRADSSTAAAQAALALKRDFGSLGGGSRELKSLAEETASAFGEEENVRAHMLLAEMLGKIRREWLSEPVAAILYACSEELMGSEDVASEYVILAICVTEISLRQHRNYRDA